MTKIVDQNGNILVRYEYDAYGNILSIIGSHANTLGKHNSLTYRSYKYDREINLYYLNSRYYNPEIGRFISSDGLLGPVGNILGHNMYAYTQNNPVMYSDISGQFPILTILTITAIVGLGLTIGGVSTDNNVMTAIGLTLVAVPALITGGLAAFAATGTISNIVGGVTIFAGLGTGAFASAEWQQVASGNNWILKTGISEEWYNGLMIGFATVATLGTAASSFTYYHDIHSIVEYGNLTGTEYKGFKFTQKAPSGRLRYRTFEFHTPHNGHGYHFQVNKFADFYRRSSVWKRWTIWP